MDNLFCLYKADAGSGAGEGIVELKTSEESEEDEEMDWDDGTRDGSGSAVAGRRSRKLFERLMSG
jgi:hypothetical protein